MALQGSLWGPDAPHPPAQPQLTHTVLAIRAELEACIANALEGAHCVDAAAVMAEATAADALVHIWGKGGGQSAGTPPPRLIRATDAGFTPSPPSSDERPYPRTPVW